MLGPPWPRVMVDGTLGGGGHAEALLEAGVERYIGIDRDPAALKAAGERLKGFGDRVSLHHGRFSSLPAILEAEGIRHVDGLLVDLGVSSHQLDASERGFSFRFEGPVDMRMDPSRGPTALAWLAETDTEELTDILRRYGEIPGARRIANAILAARRAGELETTQDLKRVVEKTAPAALKRRKVHPATMVFQALRIALNEEMKELEELLEMIPEIVAPGGKVAVISFHSLEDRRVKRAFRALAGRAPRPEGPVFEPDPVPEFEELNRKPLVAADEETRQNPRARSAKLRGIRRKRVREDDA